MNKLYKLTYTYTDNSFLGVKESNPEDLTTYQCVSYVKSVCSEDELSCLKDKEITLSHTEKLEEGSETTFCVSNNNKIFFHLTIFSINNISSIKIVDITKLSKEVIFLLSESIIV